MELKKTKFFNFKDLIKFNEKVFGSINILPFVFTIFRRSIFIFEISLIINFLA